MKVIESLDELKKIELDIMIKVHQFCEENGIKYYMIAGTLIGAIRHKGFIPWDDDIDIAMPREDYEKFLKKFPEYGKKNNLLAINNRTNPYYGRPMTKVIDTRTSLTEPEYRSDDPIGVFVDIWVMDGVPDDASKDAWLKKMRKEKEILFASAYKATTQFSFAKNLAILLGRPINYKKRAEKFDKLAQTYKYEECDTVVNYIGMTKKLETYQKSWFGEGVLVDFEGYKFWAPVKYDEWLRARFGDYMQLPPENERIPHHVMNTYWI